MQTLATLTEQQAREAPAGTKTDALVAEALGLDVRRIGNLALVWSNHYVCLVPPDRYTTERDASGEATDWMAKQEPEWESTLKHRGKTGPWAWVWFTPLPHWRHIHIDTAPTEPLARCRAVLLAAVIRREQKK